MSITFSIHGAQAQVGVVAARLSIDSNDVSAVAVQVVRFVYEVDDAFRLREPDLLRCKE